MGKIFRSRLFTMLPLFALTGLGCSQQDADALSRIGNKLASKAQSLGNNAWKHCPNPGIGLEGRVSQRLRNDKGLEAASIEVRLLGDEIELSGKLANAGQRQRALDLAESTTGVVKVKDSLQAPEAAP